MKYKVGFFFIYVLGAFAQGTYLSAMMSDEDIARRRAYEIGANVSWHLMDNQDVRVEDAYHELHNELKNIPVSRLRAVHEALSDEYGQAVTMYRLSNPHSGSIRALSVNDARTRICSAGGDDGIVTLYEKHDEQWKPVDGLSFKSLCVYHVHEVAPGTIAVGLLRDDTSCVSLYQKDDDQSWQERYMLPVSGIITSSAWTNNLKRCVVSTRDEDKGSTIQIFDGDALFHTFKTDLYITNVKWYTDNTVIMQSDDDKTQSIELNNWSAKMRVLNVDESLVVTSSDRIDDGSCVWVDGRFIEIGCEGSGLAAVAHSLYRDYMMWQEIPRDIGHNTIIKKGPLVKKEKQQD